jgi:hypothetical protein
LYYAKVHKVAVVDSFKEGNIGAATGKLSGMMQQSSGSIDVDQGNYIQQHINLLEFIKAEMSEAAGISKQREGQVSSSETVGGVERATLQSSHITEWLFSLHDNTKKRSLECLLETAKFAMKGRKEKFKYILGTGALKVIDIDGDEFSENDYGLVVDNSPETQRLSENLTQLAHAALQNQTLSFSTIMKIFTSPSLSEVQRIIEKDEKDIQERQAQQSQEQAKLQEQQIKAQMELNQKKMDLEDSLNQRDNETKIIIKEMELQSNSNQEDPDPIESSSDIMERIRQFDEKMNLERSKFSHSKYMDEQTIELKQKDLEIKKKNKQNGSR